MQFHEAVRSHMFGNGIKALSFWPPLQPFVSQKKVDELWGRILPKPGARSTVAFCREPDNFSQNVKTSPDTDKEHFSPGPWNQYFQRFFFNKK